jgi:hypothetical protein
MEEDTQRSKNVFSPDFFETFLARVPGKRRNQTITIKE